MSQEQPDLREEIEELKDRVSQLEAKLEKNLGVITKSPDIQSFIRKFNPSTHQERAVAIAYYLEHYENQETFTTADIEEGYRNCRMSLPANMSDILNGCEKNGWIMRERSDGQSPLRKLTMEGIDMVEGVIGDGA